MSVRHSRDQRTYVERRKRSPGSLHRRALGAAVLVALASVGSSCNLDPVHRTGVNALGPENDQLYPIDSAYHRPGEPCALCHSDKGPADSKFVLGGTIFWGPDDYNARVDNAYVRILDANKTKRCFVTNCNGNFYVRESDFAKITFPLLVSVERAVDPGQNETTLVIRRMSSHIGREASCATCHIQGLRDFLSPGQIRMFNTAQEFKEKKIPLATCPPPPEFDQVAQCPDDR
jgi:hypothetical protein